MRRWVTVCALALAWAGTVGRVQAGELDVVSDPHYASWQAALTALQAEARALRDAGAPEACGSYDSLRPLVLSAHQARATLLSALEARRIAPSPPPGGRAWPWAATAWPQPALAAYESLDTAVVVDDGRIVATNLNGQPEVDPLAAARAFYDAFDDDYDFLVLFTNFPSELFEGRFLAYHLGVSNGIEGLGYVYVRGSDAFDDGALYTGNNGPTRLQSFVHLNQLAWHLDDPEAIYWRQYTTPAFTAHEIGHRWGARVRLCQASGVPEALLGRGGVHWSFFFDSRGSVLEGNAWELQLGNQVSQMPTTGYGPLDLYLMGLLDPADVGTMGHLLEPNNCSPSVDVRGVPWNPSSVPAPGVSCADSRVDFGIGCIVQANGARKPAYPSTQRQFRLATMLVTQPQTPVQQAELEKLATLRANLAAYFQGQTLGRGSFDFGLRRVPARVVFEHLPQGDVEDATQPIAIRTRIGLAPRSLPTSLDDVVASVEYSVNGSPFESAPFVHETGDVYVAQMPPQPLDSEVRYYLYGTTRLSEHSYVLPAGAPQAAFSFRVAPDLLPPRITHAPVRRHSPFADFALFRAVVLDEHVVTEVSVEYGLSGEAMQTQRLERQGTTDIFEARLRLPGRVGQSVQYRIVARDAAQSPHVATAPGAGFYDLSLTRVQTEDVESVDPLWTHRSLRFDGPDEWHRERHNHTPGGRFSWKVGPDNVSTNPREGQMAAEQDVVLEGPTMVLGEGWELRFYHRYYLRVAAFDRSGVDGSILEVQFMNRPADVERDRWWLLDPASGYPAWLGDYATLNPLQGYPCWSGAHDAWRLDRVSAAVRPELTGQRVRFRFRVATSMELFGTRLGAGWYIDDIEIDPGLAVPVTLEALQAVRTEGGVRLSWRAQALQSGDLFRLRRAEAAAPGEFEPVATLEAAPSQSDYSYFDDAARPERAYVYRITLVRGQESTSHEAHVDAAALRFALHPNRPNPFNPSTQLAFELARRSPTTLVVYDVSGRRVRTLIDATLEAGPHRAVWNGTDDAGRPVASGVYLCALASAGQHTARRLLLLR